MPYACFHEYFPDVAANETRTLTVVRSDKDGLPAGRYAFLEMYCDEADCDCRRVFLMVMASAIGGPAAVIAYGWEPREFYVRWMGDDEPLITDSLKGPCLNLGSPESHLAPKILEIVRDVLLTDEAYVERLKRHYRMFRERIDQGSAALTARKPPGQPARKLRRRKR